MTVFFINMLVELRVFVHLFLSSILVRKDRKQNKAIKSLFFKPYFVKLTKMKSHGISLLVLHIYILREKGDWEINHSALPCYLGASFSINLPSRYSATLYPAFPDLFITLPTVTVQQTAYVTAVHFLFFTEVCM